jgi:hypothetical protein
MENLVFLSRVQFISTLERDLDNSVNWSWFAADLACFLAALTHLIERVINGSVGEGGQTYTAGIEFVIVSFPHLQLQRFCSAD